MPGVTVSNGGRGSRPSATPVVVGDGSRRDGPGNGRRIVFGATLEKQVPPRLPESPCKLSGMNGTNRSHNDNERKRKLRSVETLGSQIGTTCPIRRVRFRACGNPTLPSQCRRSDSVPGLALSPTRLGCLIDLRPLATHHAERTHGRPPRRGLLRPARRTPGEQCVKRFGKPNEQH